MFLEFEKIKNEAAILLRKGSLIFSFVLSGNGAGGFYAIVKRQQI